MKQSEFQSMFSVSDTTTLCLAFPPVPMFCSVRRLATLPVIALPMYMVEASNFYPNCLYPYVCNANLEYLTFTKKTYAR